MAKPKTCWFNFDANKIGRCKHCGREALHWMRPLEEKIKDREKLCSARNVKPKERINVSDNQVLQEAR